ncbi:CRP-like cAMP-binding protein [Sporomusaceae bacterium BoRhaA]|uniref:Crp/Fnr family transcriptional regulator n=1 Tax=Pelorhabdus rhamnosifermentans TaxID=2772457 RepID=UPI001FE56C23|nr:Crp/Fnr family transcriptional regulator [Pelorhabdus rhamnosifermentans]MBU2703264.1 CRP-like cAMP-binding protein [Pelorhabdus rhamnosifermentans]
MNRSISEALALIEVFRQLTPDSIAALSSCGTMCYLSKGEHLFFDKEQVEMLYIVGNGLVSLYKVNSQGEKKVIFILDKGQLINEVILQGHSASINCEAFDDAQILCFDRSDFLRVMENDFALTKFVLDSLSIKVRRLYRQLKNTSNSVRGDKRIAAKLWKLSNDYGIPCEAETKINLNLSITYLADMLGSKRETVSRQLKDLVRRGLIRVQDGQFIITDRDKLSKYFKLP